MDIRDMSKKVQKLECSMEETLEKLQLSSSKMEEAEKEFKDKEEDVNAQARRVLLLEEEVKISIEKLANTILKLATMSNEVEIENLDLQMREGRRIGHDNEMKYDNLNRSLSMMEDELKRAEKRVKNAEAKVVVIEE